MIKFLISFQVFVFTLALFSSSLVFGGSKSINFNSYKDDIEQSILFLRLRDRVVLYNEGSEKNLTPASVFKIFGSALFLSELGSDYRFETEFYSHPMNKLGVVDGDFLIRGSGDPKLTSEDLWKIVSDLKHLGYKKIKGDLVIDNSLFQDKTSNKRTMKSSQNSYDTPLSAFGVNFNTYEIALSPGAKIGDKAKVEFYPYPLGVPIRNYLVTVKDNAKEKIQVRRFLEGKAESVEISGTIKISSKLKKFNRSSYDPVMLSGRTFIAFLKSQGIEVFGGIKEGSLSQYKKVTKILSYKGGTVARYVSDLMQYSNNYMTDMLINTLGVQNKDIGLSSTHERGLLTIHSILEKHKIISKGFVLKNISGLSPSNKVSSLQIVNLLDAASKKFELFPDFLAAFPVPGGEGSLKKRFAGNEFKGFSKKIRAKTGTLLTPVSVSSLAGYLSHPRHGLIAFSIIQNGIKGRVQPNILNLRRSQELGIKSFFKM